MATSVVAILSARYQLCPQLVHLNLHAQFKNFKLLLHKYVFFELWPRGDVEAIFSHSIYLDNK